jgi:uncharacterized protein
MTFDIPFLLAATVSITCLGLSKSGFAGFALAATPVLALVMSPIQAAAILLPLMLLQDLISLWAYRRNWDRWNISVLLPAAILGMAIAWLVAAYMSEALVRFAVGLLAITFVLKTWWRAKRQEIDARPSAARGVFFGGLAGFSSTLAHAAGPPFGIFVLPQKLDKLTFAGTAAVFFTVVNAVKFVPYFALGLFSTENLTTSLMLAPLAVVTNLFGIWLLRRVPTDHFYKLAHVLVFLVSIELVRSSALALWQQSAA